MVERLLKLFSRESRGLHEAAYLLGGFAFLSQLLALLRDRLLAHTFGAGETLDVYYAAFRIPDLIFIGVASLVSLYVLIPLLSELLERGEKEKSHSLLDAVFSFFLLLILLVSAAAFLAAPALVSFAFPGLAGREGDVVLLTRILLLQPFLLGLSGLLASVTQLFRRFLLYALSPLLYNLGIIAGVVFLYPSFGVAGLGYGVLLGAALHLAIQLPFIFREGLFPRVALPWGPAVRKVLALSLPRTIALSAGQIVLLLFAGFASFMAAGSLAVFSLAFNLQAVPLTIIGVSYSVAAFPTLARLFANGDRSEFFDQVLTAARHILLWSFPAIALFIVLRAQIVRVLFGSGAFDWTDTRLTAAALALFVVSLAAQSLTLLLVRGYYAAGKTGRPLVVSLASAALAALFAWGLLALFRSSDLWRFFIESLLRVEDLPGTEVLMLPLGYSLAAIAGAAVLVAAFSRDFQPFFSSIARTTLESLAASVIMGFVAYEALGILDDVFDITTFAGIFAQGALAGIAGIAAGVAVLRLLKNREFAEAVASLRRRFWDEPVVAPEPEELR